MNQDWNSYEKSANKGPLSLVLRALVGLFIAGMVGWFLFGYIGSTTRVIDQELSPVAINQKYEWFKNAAAQLDAQQANIVANQARSKGIEDGYRNADGTLKPRGEWARDDRQALTQIDAETAGIKMAYNQLAAQYNAEMSKWHTHIWNVGEPPRGGQASALPKEYRPYQQ